MQNETKKSVSRCSIATYCNYLSLPFNLYCDYSCESNYIEPCISVYIHIAQVEVLHAKQITTVQVKVLKQSRWLLSTIFMAIAWLIGRLVCLHLCYQCNYWIKTLKLACSPKTTQARAKKLYRNVGYYVYLCTWGFASWSFQYC